MSTEIAARLKRYIARDGPISVAAYMAEVLAHPRHGYYATRDPFGAAGDFVTAPEISQMFGELLGLWCAEAWQRLGRPDPVILAELGPGRGTLMADVLRAAKMAPGFREALRVHLVEISPVLREKQRASLRDVEVTWHEGPHELPEGPILVIANEFFDALPVRQFARTPRGWCERMVGYDPETDRLAFALGPPSPQAAAYVPESLRDSAPGAVVEVSPAAISLAADLGRRIATHGGAALIVDYGRVTPKAEATLQAVRGHDRADVLADPGEADLTAHVDFPLLARALAESGTEVHGPVPQGGFLTGLGIEARAAILKRHATAGQVTQIDAALHRLTDPQQMGRLFKVLGAVPPGFGTPAGFPEPAAAGS